MGREHCTVQRLSLVKGTLPHVRDKITAECMTSVCRLKCTQGLKEVKGDDVGDGFAPPECT